MPILNSIGALSIEEGGDNVAADNSLTVYNFTKIVPNYTGSVFLMRYYVSNNRVFRIYEKSGSSYSHTATLSPPASFLGSETTANILGGDINRTGDKVVVAWEICRPNSGSVIGVKRCIVCAYSRVDINNWTLDNSITLDTTNDNYYSHFGAEISISWGSDTGCVVSQLIMDATAGTKNNGAIYYYGNIWSSSIGTVRTRLDHGSAANPSFPMAVRMSNDGNYVKAQDSSGTEYWWSTTTKTITNPVFSAKFHECITGLEDIVSGSLTDLPPLRTWSDPNHTYTIYSGNRDVSFTVAYKYGAYTLMYKLMIETDLNVITPPKTTKITLTDEFSSLATLPVGAPVSKQIATCDGDGTMTFTVSPQLPAGLSIVKSLSNTLFLTGTPTVSSNNTTYSIEVTFSGSDTVATSNISLSTYYTLAVSANNPSYSLLINKASVPTQTVSVSGSYYPVNYSISPSLPTGLFFSTVTGSINGTPTVASANTPYIITVTDLYSSKSVIVNLEVTTDTVLTTYPTSFTVGVTKSAVCAGANGTAGPFTFTASGLPEGLTMSTNGTVSGTVTPSSNLYVGDVTCLVYVTDKYNSIKTQFLIITVVSDTTVKSTLPSSFVLGRSYSNLGVTGVGLSGPFNVTVSPSLPSGLSMSSNGVITGIPNSKNDIGTKTYTFNITDVYNFTSVFTTSFSVSSDFALSTSFTSTYEIGIVPSNQYITGSGSSGPFTTTVSPSLPSWCVLSTNGNISMSAPTLADKNKTTHSFSVTDRYGVVLSYFGTIDVISPILTLVACQPISLKKSTTMVPITAVTVTKGVGPYTYSISPSLPSGFSFDSTTSVISGASGTTPSQMKNYVVTVTDSDLQTKSIVVRFGIEPEKSYTFTETASGTYPRVGFRLYPYDNSTETRIGGTYSYQTIGAGTITSSFGEVIRVGETQISHQADFTHNYVVTYKISSDKPFYIGTFAPT